MSYIDALHSILFLTPTLPATTAIRRGPLRSVQGHGGGGAHGEAGGGGAAPALRHAGQTARGGGAQAAAAGQQLQGAQEGDRAA